MKNILIGCKLGVTPCFPINVFIHFGTKFVFQDGFTILRLAA